jgi:DNA-binding CsgD family transcriptional regulator
MSNNGLRLSTNIYKRIFDLLLLVGSEREPEGLCRSFLREAAILLPFDSAVFHILGPNLTIRKSEMLGISSKTANEYLEYYVEIDCLKQQTNPDSRVLSANWDLYRNTEYVADFLSPLGITASAVLVLHDWMNRPAAAIDLNRERNQSFTERDLSILQIIQPHLENLFANLTKSIFLNNENFRSSDWLKKYPILTGREAEVAALLCRRLKIVEIGALLSISPRTVQKHIENIYVKLNVSSQTELLAKILHPKTSQFDL